DDVETPRIENAVRKERAPLAPQDSRPRHRPAAARIIRVERRNLAGTAKPRVRAQELAPFGVSLAYVAAMDVERHHSAGLRQQGRLEILHLRPDGVHRGPGCADLRELAR